jgi:hypothetical protein
MFRVEKHPTKSYQRGSVLIVFVMPSNNPMGDVGYYELRSI